jgi:hypothetical protein
VTTEATIRASSFSDLFDCAARWAAKYLEHNESTNPAPSSGRAHLGTSIHAGTAVFDNQRLGLAKKDIGHASQDDASEAFMQALQNPETDVKWLPDLSKKQAADIGILLVNRYCADISPLYSFEVVEQKCEPLQIEVDGVTITITGTNDRIQQQLELRGICDLKSGARIMRDGKVNVSPHVAQLGTYELQSIMGEKDTGKKFSLPAEIIALPTSGDMIPEVGIVRNPAHVLTGKANFPGVLKAAAGILKAGVFPGNPRSSLCSRNWCPKFDKCEWRGDTDL